MAMNKLTESQTKALTILKEYGALMPGDFAKYMWPDSPAWNRHYNCGPYGSCTGSGIRKAGGSYLGKLCKKSWLIL